MHQGAKSYSTDTMFVRQWILLPHIYIHGDTNKEGRIFTVTVTYILNYRNSLINPTARMFSNYSRG